MDLSEEERERYTRFVVDNKVQVRVYPHAKGAPAAASWRCTLLLCLIFISAAWLTPHPNSLSLHFQPCL